jgi:hypothetical protein
MSNNGLPKATINNLNRQAQNAAAIQTVNKGLVGANASYVAATAAVNKNSTAAALNRLAKARAKLAAYVQLHQNITEAIARQNVNKNFANV